MTDLAGPESAYRISLPQFEGPLDLLLHLCKTHEINVVDLPVAFITAKYLEYLELMQTMSVELASEYLVMAATLAYLKARELVPSPEPLELGDGEDGDEAMDPRQELIRRLLEYQKYKDAAANLSARPLEGRHVFVRGMALDDERGDAGLADHSVWKLIEAWSHILEKAAPDRSFDVVIDRISISDRLNQLVDMIEKGGGSFRFDSIIDTALPEAELRHQVVVTLLAVLELARTRVIRVLQDGESGSFFVARVEGAELDRARKTVITSDVTNVADTETGENSGQEPVGGPIPQQEARNHGEKEEV